MQITRYFIRFVKYDERWLASDSAVKLRKIILNHTQKSHLNAKNLRSGAEAI